MEFENEIRLRASLRKAVGEQEADTLMEKLTSIEEVRAEMHMEFAMVSARFNETDSRFNQVDARFTQIDTRFNQVDEHFNEVDARFNQIDTRFNGVDGQFIGINAQLLAMQKTFVRWGATLTISLFVTAVGVIVAAFLTR